MNNERLDYSKQIFGYSILTTRKWEVIFNRAYPKDDLTLKQFMMLLVIENAFDCDPTVKQISSELSTSHQNVKAILKQLEKKEFVEIYTDSNDKRVTRAKITNKKKSYWQSRGETDAQLLSEMFDGIELEDLKVTFKTMMHLDNIASRLLDKK